MIKTLTNLRKQEKEKFVVPKGVQDVLEDSDEEIGREFGLKVLNYYNHPNKEIAILKADLNDEYYPIEEILGGTSKELELMYNEGLSKIRNI